MAMIAAWAFCAPFGALIARTKRSWPKGKAFLYAHIFVQCGTLVLTAYGYTRAYLAINRADGVNHYEGR
jgi:hypothetical protein